MSSNDSGKENTPALSPELKKWQLGFYNGLCNLPIPHLVHFIKKIIRTKRRYVKTDTGLLFIVDPVTPFGLELMQTKVYEPEMTRLFQVTLRPGDICLDIGGYEGYFSFLATLSIGTGRVYCVEPQARLQAVIKENMRINNPASMTVVPLAFADQERMGADLFIFPSVYAACSTILKRPKYWFSKQKIDLITMDAFVEKNNLKKIRLVKIDVEGAEYLIVKGAAKTLGNRLVDVFAMNYHPAAISGEKIVATHTALKEAGYLFTKWGNFGFYHLPGLERELAGLGKLEVGVSL